MVGSDHLGFSLRLASIVVPVAVYFLILGLLNSRRHPQLLTARRDFILLLAALCPLFILPALHYPRVSLLAVPAVAVALVGLIFMFSPRGPAWVVYNISAEEARNSVAQALRLVGFEPLAEGKGFCLAGSKARVEIGGFPLLRNVTIHLRGGSRELARRFEAELQIILQGRCSETTPMASVLLLIATVMFVVPAALVAHRAVEIVRILTDLLQ